MTDGQSEACERAEEAEAAREAIRPVDPLDTQVGGDHYKRMEMPPAAFLRANEVPHAEGEVICKVLRHREKEGLKDLRKAEHTLAIIAHLDYGEALDAKPTGFRVYVAGAYTSDPVRNTRKARRIANELMLLGYHPVVPHNTHDWHEQSPKPYETWLEYGKEEMASCHVMLWDRKRLPGDSPGAKEEESLADELGIPVVRSVEELREKFPLGEQLKET